MNSSSFQASTYNKEMDNLFKQQLEKDAGELWKSKYEIKQLLHPNIPESMLPDENEIRRQPNANFTLSIIKDQQEKVT